MAKKPVSKKAAAKTTKVELPPDVTVADTAYPKFDDKNRIPYQELEALGLGTCGSELTFYQVKGARVNDWVITTLLIGGAGKRGTTARYYGITIGGNVCRVGKGPHVLKEVKVYLNKDNLPRLQKYVDLYNKGLADAGMVRDRISTRRAQGQIHRANGRTSWMW